MAIKRAMKALPLPWTLALLGGIALLAFVGAYHESNRQLVLSFEMSAPASDFFRVCLGAGDGFPDGECVRLIGWEGSARYTVRVPPDTRAIRIEPPRRTGVARVEWITLARGTKSEHRWDPHAGFAGWEVVRGRLLPPVEGRGLEVMTVSASGPAIELATLPALEPRLDVVRPLLAAIFAPLLVLVAVAAAARLRPPLGWCFATPERTFVALGLPFGLLLVALMPPFQVADESRHFQRAWQIAEGQLVPPYRERGLGAELPVDVVEATQTYEDLQWHAERKLHPARIFELLAKPRSTEKRFLYLGAANYSPAAYLTQLPGIVLGRVLPIPALWGLYLGRLASLAMALLAIRFALGLLPFFKRPMLLLALMPMTLSQLCAVSGDSGLLLTSFLFVALVLRVASGARVLDGQTALALVALAVVITLAKPIYIVVIALLLVIPRERAGGRIRLLGLFAAAGLAGLAAAVGWSRLSYLRVISQGSSVGTSQLDVIRASPLRFIGVVLWSFLYHADDLVASFVGRLGWLDVELSPLLVIPYALALLAATWTEAVGAWLGRFQRLVLAGTVAAGFGALALTMYLYLTSIGASAVAGMQGRYFIPFAPAVLLLLARRSGLGDGRWRRRLDAALPWLCFAVLTLTVLAVVDRYYLP